MIQGAHLVKEKRELPPGSTTLALPSSAALKPQVPHKQVSECWPNSLSPIARYSSGFFILSLRPRCPGPFQGGLPRADFQRYGSGPRSQRLLSRNRLAPTGGARVFTSLFYDPTRCKSFPSAIRFQLPGSSLVADSRRRLLVRSLLLEDHRSPKALISLIN